MGLAAGLLSVWLVLYGFETVVGAATDELRLVVRAGDYRPQWAVGPAVLGVLGLVLAWLRHSFFAGGSHLQERLGRAGLLAAVLLALRLPLYFLYALYFCQVTMLHGDEGNPASSSVSATPTCPSGTTAWT